MLWERSGIDREAVCGKRELRRDVLILVRSTEVPWTVCLQEVCLRLMWSCSRWGRFWSCAFRPVLTRTWNAVAYSAFRLEVLFCWCLVLDVAILSCCGHELPPSPPPPTPAFIVIVSEIGRRVAGSHKVLRHYKVLRHSGWMKYEGWSPGDFCLFLWPPRERGGGGGGGG